MVGRAVMEVGGVAVIMSSRAMVTTEAGLLGWHKWHFANLRRIPLVPHHNVQLCARFVERFLDEAHGNIFAQDRRLGSARHFAYLFPFKCLNDGTLSRGWSRLRPQADSDLLHLVLEVSNLSQNLFVTDEICTWTTTAGLCD